MLQKIKILIVGNGFGGVYTLKRLHKLFHNDKRVSLSLVGAKNYFLFTPLLHEVATGGIHGSNIIEPIRKVLGCCLDKFYLGKAEIINTRDHTVKVGDQIISYDYLVLAPGAETNFYGTPGAEEYSFTLKSIECAIKLKNHLILQIEQASTVLDSTERKKMLRFVVVGGGPTGVELAAEIEELVKETFSQYYPQEIIDDVSVVLVQREAELVPQFGPKMRRHSLEVLKRKGVEVMLESTVEEVGASYVVINKEKIPTETTIWVAGIKPAQIKFDKEIEMNGGRMAVDEYLRLRNNDNIFALGDSALFMQKEDSGTEKAVPALAQVAEKEARAVADNIHLSMKGEPLRPFYYRHTGNLMSLGQWSAVGEIFHLTFSGRIAWWIWRTVYLSKLISWRRKVRVAVDWTMNIFSPRDISQL